MASFKKCFLFSIIIFLILDFPLNVLGQEKTPARTKIDLLHEDIKKLELNVEKLSLYLDDKKDKEVDQLKKRVENFEKVLYAKELDLSKTILSSIAWGIAIALGICTFITWFGFPLFLRLIKSKFHGATQSLIDEIKIAANNEIKIETQSQLVRIHEDAKNQRNILRNEGSKVMNELQFTNFLNLGYLCWLQGQIEPAIYNTEKALREFRIDDEKIILTTKSNLGYYFAMQGKKGNKERAIELTKETLEKAEQYGKESWLANYGYVKMKYSQNCQEIREAISILQNLLKKESIKEEIEEYLKEAKTKEEHLCKNNQ